MQMNVRAAMMAESAAIDEGVGLATRRIAVGKTRTLYCVLTLELDLAEKSPGGRSVHI